MSTSQAHFWASTKLSLSLYRIVPDKPRNYVEHASSFATLILPPIKCSSHLYTCTYTTQRTLMTSRPTTPQKIMATGERSTTKQERTYLLLLEDVCPTYTNTYLMKTLHTASSRPDKTWSSKWSEAAKQTNERYSKLRYRAKKRKKCVRHKKNRARKEETKDSAMIMITRSIIKRGERRKEVIMMMINAISPVVCVYSVQTTHHTTSKCVREQASRKKLKEAASVMRNGKTPNLNLPLPSDSSTMMILPSRTLRTCQVKKKSSDKDLRACVLSLTSLRWNDDENVIYWQEQRSRPTDHLRLLVPSLAQCN